MPAHKALHLSARARLAANARSVPCTPGVHAHLVSTTLRNAPGSGIQCAPGGRWARHQVKEHNMSTTSHAPHCNRLHPTHRACPAPGATTRSPLDLTPGTRFPSPRASEGTVEVMCTYGKCTHDERPDSVHVKGANGGQWFVPLIEREPVHVCEVATCWLDHPVVTVEMPWGETVESSHAEANAHHQ